MPSFAAQRARFAKKRQANAPKDAARRIIEAVRATVWDRPDRESRSHEDDLTECGVAVGLLVGTVCSRGDKPLVDVCRVLLGALAPHLAEAHGGKGVPADSIVADLQRAMDAHRKGRLDS